MLSSDLAETDFGTLEEWAHRDFAISTAAVGMAALGALFYPPLGLVSVACLVYLTTIVWRRAYIALAEEGKVKWDMVDSIALPGFLASVHSVASSFNYWTYYLAQKIVAQVKNRSMDETINVFSEQPTFAWVQKNGTEVSTPVQELQAGDIVVVHAGGIIPVDGTITDGLASVDQRLLTGEAQPAEKGVGESVFATTVVQSGRIWVRVEKMGEETVAAQIGRVLNQTMSFAASVELRGTKVADRWALPMLALGALALPVSGPVGAFTVLNVPLADTLRVAGPLAVLNYLSIASRNHVLIKDGRVLELLRHVDTVVLDKTGTLTEEQPHIGNIYVWGKYAENELLAYAAAAEFRQTHPIARAILEAAHERQLDLPSVHFDETEHKVGYGLKVNVEDHVVQVGSARFIASEMISMPKKAATAQAYCYEQGHSLVYVAVDGRVAGAIELHTTIRPEAKRIVHELKKRRLSLYIISGDHEKPTQRLAQELGIEHYFAETLPENKADLIEQLQREGKAVCFVGDGINDAIALKKAQVSVSLRGASTVATDTAQVILMDESLNQLTTLFDLAANLETNMRNTLLMAAMPTFFCIGGVFFLHLGVYASVVLYNVGFLASVGNAMLPRLLPDNRRSKA
jgi:Cu2+-exporting ATPase